MDVYEALYTTRAMRRCRPDPIPLDVQQRILDAAVRAPSGGNTQNWRFMLVDAIFARAPGGGIECGVYYSLSKDLVAWSPMRLFKPGGLPMWAPRCRAPGNGAGGIGYPSIIDHASASVNFDSAGQTPYLYFVRATSGTSAFPRNLVRQPIILLKSPSFDG